MTVVLLLFGIILVLIGTQLSGVMYDYKGEVLKPSPQTKRIGFILTAVGSLIFVINIIALQTSKGG